MKVEIVSTSRSDRGHYAPLIKLLGADGRFDLRPRLKPDVAIVLGDRYEMLLSAAECVEERIPLLHIHGGEHTLDSLDERWRWAITMIADVHCVATEEAQWEVDSHILGDAKKGFTDAYRKLSMKTFVTGAPGLDGITERKPLNPAGRWSVLALMNPVIDPIQSALEAAAVADAITGLSAVRFRANGDRGSVDLGTWATDAETFRDALAAATVIVGNSSAGIIEAPSLGTWAVNVGDRQRGRVRAGNVIDVPAEAGAIRAALLDALQRPRYDGPNPYGDGHASERIRDVLLGMGP